MPPACAGDRAGREAGPGFDQLVVPAVLRRPLRPGIGEPDRHGPARCAGIAQASETGAVIDSALVAAIGTNQAPASAQAAQGLSVEELAPAQISLVRTTLAAGVKPAWSAREFGIPAAAMRRLQPHTTSGWNEAAIVARHSACEPRIR